jgi:hypothetical protein
MSLPDGSNVYGEIIIDNDGLDSLAGALNGVGWTARTRRSGFSGHATLFIERDDVAELETDTRGARAHLCNGRVDVASGVDLLHELSRSLRASDVPHSFELYQDNTNALQMSIAWTHAGDRRCRVCGWASVHAPWGDDGCTPSGHRCPCCAAVWGKDDSTVASAREFRRAWIAAGHPSHDPAQAEPRANLAGQLASVPELFADL